MQTKTIRYASTVPSFRRRALRLIRWLMSSRGAASAPAIPDYLRRDIGLPPARSGRRSHAPPQGNPYWRI